MPNSTYLTSQLHPIYRKKNTMWRQISASYSGGKTYSNGDYLHKFSLRESTISYDQRKKRAVYFNNVQPLADMLSGFLFSEMPTRSDMTQEYLLKKASLFYDLDKFMQIVAVNSLMYTCGVLVDSPKFSPIEIQTEAERQQKGLQPYCIFYHPWSIRNFYFDAAGVLKWVLLDNSYYDNADPFKQASQKTVYRLWTEKYYQDFESDAQIDDLNVVNVEGTITTYSQFGASFQEKPPVEHKLGEVPFVFANWSDRNDTHFADTIFEDITLFDQAIYNYMSLMDEMMSGGVFKYLFYPGNVPDEILAQGFTNMACISYPPGEHPYFDGPSLGDVAPFIQAVEFYLTGILRCVGLETDTNKDYQQSGTAKRFDFSKTMALLSSGANSMENVERNIFRLAAKWNSETDEDVTIEYKKDFLGYDQEQELERLYAAVALPYEALKKMAVKKIAKINFGKGDDSKELEDVLKQIDESSVETFQIDQAVEMEKGAREKEESEKSGDKITSEV